MKSAKNMTKKALSVLLSVVMVVTMFPMIAISSFAEGEDEVAFTKPVTSAGGWEHEKDTNYTDGRGTHYVSMKMDKTEFTFMQTKDNEKFTFAPMFQAVKNDGVNYVKLTGVTENHLGYTPAAAVWSARKDLNSKNETTTPNGAALPGSLSQGYKKQLAQNVLYWNHTVVFEGEGTAEYTTTILIDYKAGPYSMNTKEVNNYNTIDEPIVITVKVVDERELIATVEKAQELIDSGAVTGAEADALEALIAQAEDNHMTDGTVPYTQDQIDAMVEAFEHDFPVDFTEYNKALATAEQIIADPNADATLKAQLQNEITNGHPKDEVLACDKTQQAYVDEATNALNTILAGSTQESVGAPNTLTDNIPDKKYTYWVLNVDTNWDGGKINPWVKFDINNITTKDYLKNNVKDATEIILSYDEIYLDKTESIDVYKELYWRAASGFATGGTSNYYWSYAGPLSNKALNDSVVGFTPNYQSFFGDFSGNTAATSDGTITKNGNKGDKSIRDSGDIRLTGKLLNSVAVNTDDNPYYVVIPGTYVHAVCSSMWNSNSIYYQIKSFSDDASNTTYGDKTQTYYGPYKQTSTTTLEEIASAPSFKLVVYDKTPLMEAINNAVAVEYNGASNWAQWLTAINNAKAVYNNREVLQSDVEAATNALNGFLFNFDVKFTTEPEAPEISLDITARNSVSGFTASALGNTYHFDNGETVTITTASSTVDYTFTGWSDGETNATRTIVFDNSFNAVNPVTAQYTKNYADYTAVDEALANVPADLSIYSQDSVAELEKAIANVTRDLPLSQQDTVDAYADAINEALANLQQLPANYNGLDAAIEAANALPLDAIVNNQAKLDLVEAIKNAKNIDRDLDSTHQAEIDAAEQALLDALNAVTVLPADYSVLERVVTNTPENPESYYSAESYAAYEKALAAAQEVLATKGTADEYNVLGQPIIDKAVEDLQAALNNLTQNGECYYGDLDKAIAERLDIEEEFYTEESLQAYKDALAAAEAVERNMVNDNNGVNQGIIDTATENLVNATNALAIKNADYSELDAELARTPSFDKTTASAESWAKYEEALKAAEEITRNLTILDQGYIDEVTRNLADAKDELVAAGDCYYGNLDAQIDRAEHLNEDDFTPESWAAIQEALENAQNIDRNLKDNDGGANQASIDNATQAIKDAIKNAVETVTLTIMNGDTVMYTTKVAPGTTITEATTNSEYNDAYTAAMTGAKVHLGSYYSDGTSTDNSDAIYYDETIYLVIIDVEEGLEIRDNATDKVQAAIDAGFPYTAESVQKLTDAIKTAEDYVGAEQPHSIHQNQREFDALVDAVKDAANTLVYDKTKVNNAIADAEAFDQDKYTDSTAQALQDAIDNAKAVAADDNATIADMQNAIDAINNAITDLRPDKTDLDKALDDAKAIDQDKYTDETASDLQDAIDEAQRVIVDPDSTLEEVENALADLQDAIAGLVPEKGLLSDLIDDAKDTDTTGKTDSSKKDLEDAIKNAEDVLADPDATVDEIDEAIKNLQDAIDGLEDKADYTAEQEAYDEIKAIDTTNLTPETKQKIEDAIKAADDLDKDLPAMKQGDVDAVTDALKDAIRDAVANELNNLLDEARGTDTTGKTDESTKALEDAIDNAEDILGKTDPAATQEEIEDAIKAIEDALAGLEDKADYTDEEAAYDLAKEIDTSDLSEETKQKLQDAIAAADALDKDLPADEQATVDAVTDSLIDALKDALKDKIDNAIDDSNGMSDESKDNLQDVIDDANDVINNPDATPEDIENAIKDLEDAVNNLTDDITITVVDDEGHTITEITEKVGMTIDEIAEDLKDTIPQDKDGKDLVGFVDENGNYIPDDTVITGSETIKPVYELTEITPKEETTIGIDRRDDLDGTDGLIDGFKVGNNTVDEIKALLENDELQIIVVDVNGNELTGTDLVGTGSVITYKSKLTGKVYEKLTVIVYGDVDGDGAITNDDFNTLKGVAKAQTKITNVYFVMAADCNGDKVIDGFDATYASCAAHGKDKIAQSRLILK